MPQGLNYFTFFPETGLFAVTGYKYEISNREMETLSYLEADFGSSDFHAGYNKHKPTFNFNFNSINLIAVLTLSNQ